MQSSSLPVFSTAQTLPLGATATSTGSLAAPVVTVENVAPLSLPMTSSAGSANHTSPPCPAASCCGRAVADGFVRVASDAPPSVLRPMSPLPVSE